MGPSNVFPKPSIDSDAPSSLRTTGLETNLPTFFQNVNEKYKKKKKKPNQPGGTDVGSQPQCFITISQPTSVACNERILGDSPYV